MGDFKVLIVNTYQQPEQYVSIQFSDPLKMGQDLRGLVHLSTSTELNLIIEGNEIQAFPRTRQAGDVKLVVEPGVKNSMSYEMKDQVTEQLVFTNIKPAVELLGEGVIIPATDDKIVFPFKAVNISGVNVRVVKVFENNIPQFLQENRLDQHREMRRVGRVVYKGEVNLTSEDNIDFGRWNNFSLDLSKLIKTEPGAIYRVSLSFDKKHSLYTCISEEGEDEEDLTSFSLIDQEEVYYDNVKSGYYYFYNGWNQIY